MFSRLKMKLSSTISAAVVVAFVSVAQAAEASLIKGDFTSTGDGYLVTDTVTMLEWLTPFYTRGHTWNDIFIQGLAAIDGFRYATAAETVAMINNNFGTQTTSHPGDASGYAAAQSFFNLFGVNAFVTCSGGAGPVPCPRTQGLTADVGFPGTHVAFGFIQFGSTGRLIANNNNWGDSFADSQMGSFLVREVQPSAVPDKASAALLLGLVLAGMGGFVGRGAGPRPNLPG